MRYVCSNRSLIITRVFQVCLKIEISGKVNLTLLTLTGEVQSTFEFAQSTTLATVNSIVATSKDFALTRVALVMPNGVLLSQLPPGLLLSDYLGDPVV